MRKFIKDLIEKDPMLQVIGTARNGQDALKQLPHLTPDVITLDVEMPILDGLSTLQEIVKNYTVPVVMLSSTTSAGAENTMKCLEIGAFDFITKPSGSISLDLYKVQDELIEKIKLASTHKRPLHSSRLNIVKKAEVDIKSRKQEAPPTMKSSVRIKHTAPGPASVPRSPSQPVKQIVLIGTSTGGPKALYTLLSKLERFDDVAVLIVQHMPPTFTQSLANRLNQFTKHHVSEAKNGEEIMGGHVYIAPGDYHMGVTAKNSKLFVHLHQEAPRSGHRPSVDVLFESVINITQLKLTTVVMTGMGRDGTQGLKQLSATHPNIHRIAENESSCVVYGMPKSVIEAHLIDCTAPLDELHLEIEKSILN